LIKSNIQLIDYFKSDLVWFNIKNSSYIDLSTDSRTLIIKSHNDRIEEIFSDYDNIVGKEVKEKINKLEKETIQYYLLNIPQTMTNNPQ
jgi:hypothetical protein